MFSSTLSLIRLKMLAVLFDFISGHDENENNTKSFIVVLIIFYLYKTI